MSAVSSYLHRFMANHRDTISWLRTPRWEYRLNKGAHTALITITLMWLGVDPWHALTWAIGLYWAIPKTYYFVSWFVWRPAASKAFRHLRSVFNKPYQPDPSDWLADLLCCGMIAPVLIYQDYGLALAVIAAGAWLFGYGILWPEASP